MDDSSHIENTDGRAGEILICVRSWSSVQYQSNGAPAESAAGNKGGRDPSRPANGFSRSSVDENNHENSNCFSCLRDADGCRYCRREASHYSRGLLRPGSRLRPADLSRRKGGRVCRHIDRPKLNRKRSEVWIVPFDGSSEPWPLTSAERQSPGQVLPADGQGPAATGGRDRQMGQAGRSDRADSTASGIGG
jgi:hypothetical protein